MITLEFRDVHRNGTTNAVVDVIVSGSRLFTDTVTADSAASRAQFAKGASKAIHQASDSPEAVQQTAELIDKQLLRLIDLAIPENEVDGDPAGIATGAAKGEEHVSAADGSISSMTSDIGNAARFSESNRNRLRYCYVWGKWLYWDLKRWKIDDRGVVISLAKNTALNIYIEAAHEADDGTRERLFAHAKASQKRDRINAMIELAKPDLAITPDDMDADPYLLNCLNGTIDLRTQSCRQHRREDYITKLANARFDPDATADVFDAVLARIFRTHPQLIAYLQRVLGYGSTGLTVEQVLFFLYGSGANGKTTLLDAIVSVLGDYAGKADRDLLTAGEGASHPCNVADLMGIRLAVCSETNDGKRFDEAKLKDLVGETTIKARFMRQDFFSFKITSKIFLYSNHKPVVRGTDYGFWRRMRLIPFVETISDDEKDKQLPSKLRAEADGILLWIVNGFAAWQRDGLGVPAEVEEATRAYRVEMDSIGAFIEECCEEGETLKAYARDLYEGYTGWCTSAGEHPLSQKRLGTTLAERGFSNARCSYSNRKMWVGIALKSTAQAQN